MLNEVAPGIDINRDIISRMEFAPVISPGLKEIPKEIFLEEKMGLVDKI